MAGPVIRRWEARASTEGIEAWLTQFHERVMPNYRAANGFRWVKVLVSRGQEQRLVTVLTAWDDMDAVKRFAGPDPDKAVMPGWVAELMPDHDDFAIHSDEVLAEGSP
ncbi:MAG: hypothetical protein AAF501_11910 [Pseudomonadota bacterium]